MIKKIQKTRSGKRVARPKQTGFSSPATHYFEPTIDLNEELVRDSDATFFIRAKSDEYREYNIAKNDVLIVDRSIAPDEHNLVVLIIEDRFTVGRISKNSKEPILIWGVVTYIIKNQL